MRTDMKKLIVAFRNIANAPKNWKQEVPGRSPLRGRRYAMDKNAILEKQKTWFLREST